MIRILQGEVYRVCKSRLFWICVSISTFFVFALALSFNYNAVKLPVRSGVNVAASLNQFTEFLFLDFSFVLPLTLFLGFYFTEDFRNGTYAILSAKGVSRKDFFFGKLLSSWIATTLYFTISCLMAYMFIFSMWAKQPSVTYSLPVIGGYLVLQILCFIGYSSLMCMLSYLLRFRSLVLITSTVLLGAMYLYLTKISTALDLSYSLYQYWIVGLSGNMKINLYLSQLPVILITIFAYVLLPAALSYTIFQKADLRKQERR